MAKVHFPEDELVAEAKDGERLEDIVIDNDASIPFGCREGVCATCIVKPTAGGENLSPLNDEERSTLTPDEISDGFRLACQCRVIGGEVTIVSADAL